VEVSEAAAIALQDEIRQSAVRGDLERELPDDGAPADPDTAGATREQPEGGLRLAREPEETVAGEPLESSDPMAGLSEEVAVASAPQGEAVADAATSTTASQLFVMVSGAPEPPGVTVTRSPESKSGYARAIALRPDGRGGVTWTQATVTSEEEEGPRLALVMLGAESPWW
jgi:hypothetical protein